MASGEGQPGQPAPRWQRAFQPPRGGLSSGDYFELQLLAVASLLLFPIALFTTIVFPLLLGFSLLYFAIEAGATLGIAGAYLLAMKGRRDASTWVLLGLLAAGIWALMLFEPHAPDHATYMLTNLLLVGLAFALRRVAFAWSVVAAVLLYMAVAQSRMDHSVAESLSIAVVFLAGSLLAALAPALRAKERQRATKAEADLRRNEDMLNRTQALSRVGGWEYDTTTGGVAWTREVYDLHELPETFDPKDATSLFDMYDEDDRLRLLAATQEALARGKPYDLQVRLTTAKGRRLTVRSMGRAEVKDGKVVRLLGTMMDITALKEAEAARAELASKGAEVKRLERLNQMRMDFLNTAAHDLKTPLTPLKLQMATLRMKGGLAPAQVASLDLMDRNILRFQVLVEDMLDAARLQAGKLNLRRAATPLGPLVREAVASFEEAARTAGVQIEVALEREAVIDADPAKCMQVPDEPRQQRRQVHVGRRPHARWRRRGGHAGGGVRAGRRHRDGARADRAPLPALRAPA